jgi:flagellar biosynthesis regulator FlaF
MAINIPDSVFTKYNEVVDSTFTIFGVTCQLVYIEKVEEVVESYDNIPTNNSINAHRRKQDQYKRQNKIIKEVEKTEDIKIKIYWDNKSWTKVGSDMVIPDNSIQTIFYATDLDKIMRAKELIAHKDIKDLREMRFKRFGEPFPMGLKQNRYFGCFWERAS